VQQAADGTPIPRIADFGIGGVAAGQALAKSGRAVSQGAFLVSALRGACTPLYASPQQMRGLPPDVRDDVFALGVMWYQMLTGNLVAGRPGGARWVQRLTEQGVSAQMCELLSHCIEEDPADRPRDAAELADRLDALLTPLPKTVPVATPPTPAPPPVVRPPTPPRKGLRPALRPAPTPPPVAGGKAVEWKPIAEPPLSDPTPISEPAPVTQGPRTLTNSINMRFVLIPAGTFLMGSPPGEDRRGGDEGPPRRVTISRPFHLGIGPVTQQEYQAVMGANPSHFKRGNSGGLTHPVEQVSWELAAEFCRRLSALPEEGKAGRRYSLPTEAEWEYACRAGCASPFAFGEALGAADANFDAARPYGGGSSGRKLERTSKLGAFAANAWGLMDMHGNVWEWCRDWYDEATYQGGPATDPEGPSRGAMKVVRGGSWDNSGHLCRSAKRNKYAVDFCNDTIGFRVALYSS
jgi:formylglycine-generating enzyme required for sulfatase activity